MRWRKVGDVKGKREIWRCNLCTVLYCTLVLGLVTQFAGSGCLRPVEKAEVTVADFERCGANVGRLFGCTVFVHTVVYVVKILK